MILDAQISTELRNRILGIRMLVFDVDGVLTDGRIILGNNGAELKEFDVQDGMGITLARKAGLLTGIITGRESEVVVRRAGELKFDAVYQGAADKQVAFDDLLKRRGLEEGQAAYMGDDLLDLCLLRRAGLAVSPANGRPEVRAVCHYVTRAAGGSGAVRELVELVLHVQNSWDTVLKNY